LVFGAISNSSAAAAVVDENRLGKQMRHCDGGFGRGRQDGWEDSRLGRNGLADLILPTSVFIHTGEGEKMGAASQFMQAKKKKAMTV
jgi:hypothetical protein